ncbi:glycosyltransferase family 1 protein [Cesiribacter sp. SM1]|uniref:glycosyltransferase family 4 protein n=1 Tax=Cesiribacter sp. SM1 TaxID=2861196 RepID=UPI001CD5BBA8|nr:glycosyltransferase family 1 protein [Cesiribacter sp. SM1]
MKRPLRIGIEIQRIFRPKKHGMEIVALELVRQLQQMDKQNEYVIFAKDDVDTGCLSETENFKIKKLPAYTYADWEQIQLPKAVKEAKLDFLHSTCNTSSILQPVPLLLTVHDVIYLEKVDFKGTAYQNFGNLYRRFVVPKVVQKSEMIFTVSNFERETILESLKLPEDKVKVVYNAISSKFNTDYSAAGLKSFREKNNLPDKFILFLGNTAPKKNTFRVIQAFAEYSLANKDAIPMVILDCTPALVSDMLDKLGHKQLLSRFIFPGYISPDQMPLMYNAATLFLYPSLRESFGLPILEAMACATPVITSNTSSMPEVAGGAALLVDPFKYEEIAAGIDKILGDEALRQDMVKQGVERASKFTWEASAGALLEFYDSMPKRNKALVAAL